MSTEKTPNFTIIVADTPDEVALASSNAKREVEKEAKKQAEEKRVAEVQNQINAIKSGQIRMYPIDMQSLYDEPNSVLRSKLISTVVDANRTEIARNTKSYINDKYGRSQYTIAEDCGIDRTAFAKSMNHKFYVPLDSCEKLCYKYLNKTVHELMFGAPKVTPLPRHLNFLGQELAKLSESDGDGAYELCSLYMTCKEIFDKDSDRNDDLLSQPTAEGAALAICKERIFEIAGGLFSLPEESAGHSLSPNVRSWIRKVTYSENERCTIFSIMHLAIEYQTTLDYLLVRNYAQLGDICCRSEDGADILITDRYAKDIISMILQMSEHARAEFLRQAWSRLLFK